MQQLASDKSLLDNLKKLQWNGYSALSAAMLAPDVSIERKRNFIAQLMKLGFTLTPKDRILAELMLYEAIPDDKKENILLFLKQAQRDGLVEDVRKKIVSCMIDLYRQAAWPLPEIADKK